jgi:hypothetical protein
MPSHNFNGCGEAGEGVRGGIAAAPAPTGTESFLGGLCPQLKAIKWLLGSVSVLGALMLWLVGAAVSKAEAAERKVQAAEVALGKLNTDIEYIRDALKRIETKVDKK